MELSVPFQLAVITVVAFLCQWASWRIKLPAILPLLISGLLLGSVTGLIQPRDLFGDLLLPGVSLAVSIILFEGALTLRFDEIRGLEKTVRRLVTWGALVTWGVFSGLASRGYRGVRFANNAHSNSSRVALSRRLFAPTAGLSLREKRSARGASGLRSTSAPEDTPTDENRFLLDADAVATLPGWRRGRRIAGGRSATRAVALGRASPWRQPHDRREGRAGAASVFRHSALGKQPDELRDLPPRRA